MSIRTAAYELVLGKANGQILDIIDLAHSRSLTLGSQAGCLWTASIGVDGQNRFTGGCGFSSIGTSQFRYSWLPDSAVLQLSYVSSNPELPSAIVGLGFSTAPHFDMALVLQNQTRGVIQSVGLPGSLRVQAARLDGAYLPFLLPGARLRPKFFSERRSAAQTYPSQLCFADYFAVDIQGSLLSVYTVNPEGPIQPALLGLFDDDSEPGNVVQTHRFETSVAPGATYSSPIVRVRIGGSPREALEAYRRENGIDAYLGVAQKLGDRFLSFARSPVVRADFQLFRRTFSRWTADLGRIKAPAIIHPVGFQPGGHDHSYPDLLPPNPSYGATADFRRFAAEAAVLGFFVMPHTNYTWWNPAAPSLQRLSPSEAASLMVMRPGGEPQYEEYGNAEETNGGFVVSPSVPAVRTRIREAWGEWQNEVGIDLLFQDQIGARPWLRDHNPAADSPLRYADRWIEILDSSPSILSATEGGFDRLAKRLWGFFGSSLSGPFSRFAPREVQWGVDSPGNFLFGPGNWEPYPIATWLLHDKVLFYQHNLEIASYTENIEVLSWNALFGYMQVLLWPGTPGRLEDLGWLDLAQSAQSVISARQAGQGMAEFERPEPHVAYSRIGEVETFANWEVNQTHPTPWGSIAPSGFLSRTRDGAVTAGLFQGEFLGQSLSPGTHAILLERDATLVSLRHPIGPATTFIIPAPARWGTSNSQGAFGVDRDNNLLGAVSRTVEGNQIRFSSASIAGKRPSRFLFQSGGDLVCTDGAAFQFGPVSPGLIVSVFGNDIGPAQPQSVRLNAEGLISTELGGVRVLFGGTAAPLLFASRGQINAIVPYDTARRDAVRVEITRGGMSSGSVTVPVVNAVPRLFTSNSMGTGQIAAVNEDGRINSAQNAVRRGSVITLYGTGGGLESRPAKDGELARDASRTTRLPVTVRIGGRPADVLYSGAAPGFAGMLQINARVPLLSARGDAVPLEVSAGDTPAQAPLSIAVQ